MAKVMGSGLTLGINGFGRIGKLTVWHHVARKYFDEIVVNIGRRAGVSLEDIAHYVERDSTYGWLHGYLYGHQGQPVVSKIDESSGTMVIDGVKIHFLRTHRLRLNGTTTTSGWWSTPPVNFWILPWRRTIPGGRHGAIWNPGRKR